MNILTVAVTLIVGLLVLGISFEIVMSAINRRRYGVPPGERIDVDGKTFHIVRRGQHDDDKPTVILEAGIGGNWLDWELVVPEIANMTQVVAYDRAGYGWSDAGDEPRTPEKIVTELHDVLQAAQIAPPYILVGHSFGGFYARLFASTYPDAVAGVILVEASNLTMIDQQDTQAELRRLRNVAIAKRIGLLRLMVSRLMHRVDYLFGDSKRRYRALNLQDSGNVAREAAPIFDGDFVLPDAINTPLTVISRKPDDDISAERKWHEYQQELVALSPTAKHMISEKGSHYLGLADPEIVVAAVREMLTAPSEQTDTPQSA